MVVLTRPDVPLEKITLDGFVRLSDDDKRLTNVFGASVRGGTSLARVERLYIISIRPDRSGGHDPNGRYDPERKFCTPRLIRLPIEQLLDRCYSLA